LAQKRCDEQNSHCEECYEKYAINILQGWRREEKKKWRLIDSNRERDRDRERCSIFK
jgi:hypothetical protein